MARRKQLLGTPAEHADEALRFFRSAENNYSQRADTRPAFACGNIEHMTDVVAEASIAAVAADHAGDKTLASRADKLVHDATVRQRELVASCRRRERDLTVNNQAGDFRRRRR